MYVPCPQLRLACLKNGDTASEWPVDFGDLAIVVLLGKEGSFGNIYHPEGWNYAGRIESVLLSLRI